MIKDDAQKQAARDKAKYVLVRPYQFAAGSTRKASATIDQARRTPLPAGLRDVADV